MKMGTVYLVGSGPGDPGLLTLRASEHLASADLIVYDYLANPAHLRHARRGAKRVCVGKGFRHKAISQDRINRMILTAARSGHNVVRLKGGDPYLFGRGGEEALYLAKHGIPFEVVPGVTSATACAAYAGIPLTHRDHNASVTFLTGHRADDDRLDSIAWEKIVGLGGTIVIYMGLYNLAKIAGRLIEKGLSPATEAAVIEWGTLPRQRVCRAALRGIAAAVRKAGLKAPCIIIIGDVVKLRPKLSWYERLPLFGKKVVVTRARCQAGGLAERLERLGAEVVEFPTIEIAGPPSPATVDRAIRALRPGDFAVFTSAHGVRGFFGRAAALKLDARRLYGVRVAAVGPETARVLAKYGVIADLVPERYETRALLSAIRRSGSARGKRVWLFRTDIADDRIEKGLKRMGAVPSAVTTYRTVRPARPDRELARRLSHEKIDLITFTSASTARHFSTVIGSARARALSRRCVFASIGPVTSRQMRSLGMRVGCQAKIFTIDGLVAAVKNRAHHGVSRH